MRDRGLGTGRRAFLGGTAVLAGTLILPPSVAGAAGTRLILLGTAGGPRPRTTRSGPAQVVVADGRACVVDCGDGVARQMVLAGVPLPSLRHVFITHHHSDHNADYGNLLLLAWASGLKTAVDTWGPPPLARMTELFLDMSDADVRTRIADEGRVPLAPLVRPHELTQDGVIVRDEMIKVTVALVDHPPVVPAFAYRFDTADGSIVISGDTRASDNLLRLARGSDILVHEAMNPGAVERLVAGVANATTLKESILRHHTTAEEAGRIAQAAGVKTLVLSHFVPAEDPTLSEASWAEAARTHFRGRVVVGKDLLEIGL